MISSLPTFAELIFQPFVVYIPAVIFGLIVWAFLDTFVVFLMMVWEAINFR